MTSPVTMTSTFYSTMVSHQPQQQTPRFMAIGQYMSAQDELITDSL